MASAINFCKGFIGIAKAHGDRARCQFDAFRQPVKIVPFDPADLGSGDLDQNGRLRGQGAAHIVKPHPELFPVPLFIPGRLSRSHALQMDDDVGAA